MAWIVTILVFSLIVSSANLSAASRADSPELNQDILDAVAELYGISEDQAIDRMAREAKAAISLMQIKDLPIKGYAGSWFDESTLRLMVAMADPKEADLLELFDVDLVFVKHSLADLQKMRDGARDRLSLESSLNPRMVTSYIDYKTNAVVLGVEGNYVQSVRSELAKSEFSESTRVEESGDIPTISTGFVRGGDGTRNLTWQAHPSVDVAPCSVGAAVEDGFVTAGHCAFLGNSIGDSNDNPLGTTVGSAFDYDNPYVDAGYVETLTGWTPTSQVNGYTDGIFSVSEEWAGMIEYPVGSTVCRYGQTSGGPYCGTVNQLDLDQEFVIGWNSVTGWITQITLGTTRVAGSCTDSGDSGGTWVGGTGQVQGVNIGGTPIDTCPTSATWTYYQPIKDVVDEFDVTMLTPHGSSAPLITSIVCPHEEISGLGRFLCRVDDIESQGEVEILWTSNVASSSTNLGYFKRCESGPGVYVTFEATNTYGTTTLNFQFACPLNEVP